MKSEPIVIEGMSLNSPRTDQILSQACQELRGKITVLNLATHLKHKGITMTEKQIKAYLVRQSEANLMNSFSETFDYRYQCPAKERVERWYFMKPHNRQKKRNNTTA